MSSYDYNGRNKSTKKKHRAALVVDQEESSNDEDHYDDTEDPPRFVDEEYQSADIEPTKTKGGPVSFESSSSRRKRRYWVDISLLCAALAIGLVPTFFLVRRYYRDDDSSDTAATTTSVISPTNDPTVVPTEASTSVPTKAPTKAPTKTPIQTSLIADEEETNVPTERIEDRATSAPTNNMALSMSPTASPTLVPTIGPTNPTDPFFIPMEQNQRLASGETPGSSWGAAIALDSTGTLLSVGAPRSGKVFWYGLINHEWELIHQVDSIDADFGRALDQSGSSTLVGAPDATAGIRHSGAAFLYRYNPNDVDNPWQVQGGAIMGNSATGTSFSNRERFGQVVALCEKADGSATVAIGAPDYQSRRGRLYILELVSDEWIPVTTDVPSIGRVVGAEYGSTVDISNDASVVAVGAPGDDSFDIFEKSATGTWTRTFREEEARNSAVGVSVTVISNDYVAVGRPLSPTSSGSILLYQKVGGEWTRQKDIVAPDENQIGLNGLVAGRVGEFGYPEITFATTSGQVRRRDYIDNQWEERFHLDTEMNNLSSLIVHQDGARFSFWISSSTSEEAWKYIEILTPGWQIASGPFSGQLDNTSFGTSACMSGTVAAVGAPGFSSGSGSVQTFFKENGLWRPTSYLLEGGSRSFGQALDVSFSSLRTTLIVGAPRSLDMFDFGFTFGTVFYYEWDEQNLLWSLVGDPLGPFQETPPHAATPLEADGDFGAAVAVASSTQIIAVGGPRIDVSADQVDNGKVYTYQYDGSVFSLLAQPLEGPSPGDLFGSALAMNEDGTRLLVGAPGEASSGGTGAGAAYYFHWDEGSWQSLWPVVNSVPGEHLGASVAIITEDGDTIAVGAPNALGGQGLVRVYRRGELVWDLLGSDIIGSRDQRLGSSLSGHNGRLVAGTAKESFRVYDYDETSKEWFEAEDATETGSDVVSIATGSTGDVLVGMQNEQVAFYGFY